MTDREYTCAHCGGTFKRGWSEEEALAEKQQLWGDLPLEECAQLCDDCFVEFNKWLREKEGHG
jgi:hypothetical protein